MNILITGASGLIGTAIIEKLQGQDHKIYAISRSNKKSNGNINWIKHDLYNDSVSSLILPKKIDVVFHLSGQTSIYDARKNPIFDLNANVLGFLNLLEYFKSQRQKPFVVLAGTATEAGIVDLLPINEKTQDRPITFYDLSKLTAEMYLKQYIREGWARGCILRLANVYGRSQKQQLEDRGIVDKIFRRALAKKNITVFGDGNYIRDYVFIDDVVMAFILSEQFSDKTNGLTFYIGSGEGIALKDAFQAIIYLAAKLTGKTVSCEHVKPPDNLSEIEFRDAIIDSSAFTNLTGWKPRYSFTEGLDIAYKNYFDK